MLPKRKPRRDQLSCRACVTKKLKCDRQQPCANCTLRNRACQYGRDAPVPAPRPAPETPGSTLSEHDLRTEAILLRERLDKLERAIGGRPVDRTEPEFPLASHAAASQWLDISFVSAPETLPNFSDSLQYQCQTLDQLAAEAACLPQRRVITLPDADLAFRFLDLYECFPDVNHVILHLPSVRGQFKSAYSRLPEHQPASEITILILAVCAYVGFWDSFRGSLFLSPEAASSVYTLLAKQALYMIEHTQKPSIELIQATVLVVNFFFHIEGSSSRTRLLHTRSLAMAHDLALHLIDAPSAHSSSSVSGQSQLMHNNWRDAAQIETHRRLWWHIVGTDWLLAFVRGPHHGVYMANPRHFKVNKPSHLPDAGLDSQLGSPPSGHGELEATLETFFMLKTELATVCREAVDRLDKDAELEDVHYQFISELDSKLRALFERLPVSTEVDGAGINDPGLEDPYRAHLVLQRVMANIMVHTRRCKLHLPFLVRLRSDARFLFSRAWCLESARKILTVQRIVMGPALGSLASFLQFGGILHHSLYAIVVLVTDLCLNKENNRDQHHSRLIEVRDALDMVEHTKYRDETAAKFLESLKDVLRKHHVQLPSAGNPPAKQGTTIRTRHEPIRNSELASEVEQLGSIAQTDINIGSNDISGHPSQVNEFEDVWQGFLNGHESPLLDLPSWDALVSDLEMRII